MGQMPVGGVIDCDQYTKQKHKGGIPWMCDQHNARATAGDNTGQNRQNTHTQSQDRN